MWIWRKITKTSWTQRKSNEQVLNEVRERRALIETIEKRKSKHNGHQIRHNEILNSIFEGKILGKRTRGRPGLPILQDVKSRMDCSSFQEMEELAKDRKNWLKRQGTSLD
ncbi:hypothetical protein J437_LFUL003534 [Ladona fulva]|uniref:Uncharacterized protein n=1 Tax=Ladona fulva TaxID=123851 RepID=A0A8K0NX10_LADFU|nr:hypothetical protein J437_LFUL003534 [Ladona fulva]